MGRKNETRAVKDQKSNVEGQYTFKYGYVTRGVERVVPIVPQNGRVSRTDSGLKERVQFQRLRSRRTRFEPHSALLLVPFHHAPYAASNSLLYVYTVIFSEDFADFICPCLCRALRYAGP